MFSGEDGVLKKHDVIICTSYTSDSISDIESFRQNLKPSNICEVKSFSETPIGFQEHNTDINVIYNAKGKLYAGDFIGFIWGSIEPLQKHQEHPNNFLLSFGEKHSLLIEYSWVRYVGHSCVPNAIVCFVMNKGKVFLALIACATIRQGLYSPISKTHTHFTLLFRGVNNKKV